MKRSEDTSSLPPNIFKVMRNTEQEGKFCAGYKYQIKIGSKLHVKAFTKKDLTMEEKL